MSNAEYDLLDAQADARRLELQQIINANTKFNPFGTIVNPAGKAAQSELDSLNKIVGIRGTIRKQLIAATNQQVTTNEALRQNNIDLKE